MIVEVIGSECTVAPAMAKVAPGAADKIREAMPGPFAFVARLLALLAPAVPLATTAGFEIGRGWRPTSDDAAIAWRAYDVFSSHAPLLGAYNDATVSAAHPIFDLGPLQYYLLAVPDRIDPVHGILWGSVLLAAMFAGLSVEAAWRAGGLFAGVAVSAGYVVLAATQTGVVLNLPWNPNFGVYAFSATLVLAAVTASGRTGWWPLAVFTGCVALECHLIYGAAAGAGVVVSIFLGLLARRRRSHASVADASAAEPAPPAQPAGATGGAGRAAGAGAAVWRPSLVSLAAGVVVGVLSLLPTAIEQLADHPGNVTALLRNLAHQGQSRGISSGLQAIGRAAGIWPAWTHPVPPIGTLAPDERFMSALLIGSSATGLVLIIVSLVIGVVALLTRRTGLGGLACIASISGLALAWTMGSIATSQTAILTYGDVALWPVGMVLDAAIVWGIVELCRGLAKARSTDGVARVARGAGVMAVAGLAAAGAWSVTSLVPDLPHSDAIIGGWEVARAVGPIATTIERSGAHGPLVVEPADHLLPNGLPTWALTEAVGYELKVSGVDARVLPPMGPHLGSDASPPSRATVYELIDLGHGRWKVREVARTFPMSILAWVSER
jgi:hypothetical protein